MEFFDYETTCHVVFIKAVMKALGDQGIRKRYLEVRSAISGN